MLVHTLNFEVTAPGPHDLEANARRIACQAFGSRPFELFCLGPATPGDEDVDKSGWNHVLYWKADFMAVAIQNKEDDSCNV